MEADQVEKNERHSIFSRGFAKLLSLARQKDTPHRIALGMALGIFVGLLPIMGIQMAVVTLFALPLRGNLKAAIAGVWISNPITFIPMYWTYYRFGLFFMPGNQVSWSSFSQSITKYAEWDKVLDLSMDILGPMCVGSLIMAVLGGAITYFVAYWFVENHRERRGRQ
jgi:uncharacterized protein (DUF2062 family)